MGRRTILLIVAIVIAALGASLVFLYVRGVEAKATEGRELVEVLVASATINAGESVEEAQQAGKLDLVDVPRENLVPGALTDTNTLTGLVALSPIFSGEQILQERFGVAGTQGELPIPKGTMAVSVQLSDPARVAGYVNPGSTVAIFVTGTPELIDEDGNTRVQPDFTRLLFADIQVIGVGSTTVVPSTTTDESGTETTEEIPRTILTLALTQAQAERVIYSSSHGELSLGLMTDDSVVSPGPPVTYDELFE